MTYIKILCVHEHRRHHEQYNLNRFWTGPTFVTFVWLGSRVKQKMNNVH